MVSKRDVFFKDYFPVPKISRQNSHGSKGCIFPLLRIVTASVRTYLTSLSLEYRTHSSKSVVFSVG